MSTWTREELHELALLLHSGLCALAANDPDMAKKENEIGFNGRDSRFGHMLVAIDPEDWSPRQLETAFRIARTYSKTQLRGLGVDWTRVYVADEADTQAWRAARGAKAVARATLGKNGRGAEGILFEFTYSAEIVARLKAVRAWFMPDRTTRGADARSVWWASLDNDAAREYVQAEWDMSDGLMLALARAEALKGIQEREESKVEPCFVGTLRPFQETGSRWLVSKRMGLLADDMGTGKTVQVLAAASQAGAWPLLVICPKVVKLNWAKEAMRFVPSKSVSVLGEKRARVLVDGVVRTVECGNAEADIVIVNYDIVGKHMGVLETRAWGAAVADESHYLKSRDAARTKTVSMLMTGYDPARKQQVRPGVPRRWLLSGTPMLNRPIELVSQLTIIDGLRPLGGWRGFTERYCEPFHNGFAWDYSGHANMAELGERLTETCMLRRTKAEVLPELPPKGRSYVSVSLANEAEYERAQGAVAKWIGECRAKDAEFMSELYAKAAEAGLEGEDYDTFMARSIEARERSATKVAERAEALVRFSALKRLAAKGKMPAAVQWIEDFFEAGGKKLVVFAHHVETVDELAAMYGAPKISGSVSMAERQAAIDKFQCDTECRVIVCNIQAGGVGVTLTAASDVLFVEQHWNPGTHDQAEDRVNRLGQTKACMAYYLIGSGTIDEEIATLIEGKREIVDDGIGDRALKTLGDGLLQKGGK